MAQKLNLVVHAFNSQHLGNRQVGLCEFHASRRCIMRLCLKIIAWGEDINGSMLA